MHAQPKPRSACRHSPANCVMRSLSARTETPKSDSATRSGVERGHAAGVRRLGTDPEILSLRHATFFSPTVVRARHAS